MKRWSARMPPRLRGALLALSLAAMTIQVRGASAAPEKVRSLPVAPVIAASIALPGKAAKPGLASLLPGPPVSGGWGLLVAGLLGVGAIGQRRLSSPASRSLEPRRLRRR